MNSKPETPNPKSQRAFTLVELLVVIAVIAILAGLLFTGLNGLGKARIMATAKAEMTQISTAIEAYKAKYGFYPPNGTNSIRNPLYYELTGMLIANPNFRSLDGSYTVLQNTVLSSLVIPGIVNASTTAQATDDRPAIESFLKDLKPGQIGTNPAVGNIRMLKCSAGDDDSYWQYNSANPTNNSRSFDLWVNVTIGGETKKIGNWNSNP